MKGQMEERERAKQATQSGSSGELIDTGSKAALPLLCRLKLAINFNCHHFTDR